MRNSNSDVLTLPAGLILSCRFHIDDILNRIRGSSTDLFERGFCVLPLAPFARSSRQDVLSEATRVLRTLLACKSSGSSNQNMDLRRSPSPNSNTAYNNSRKRCGTGLWRVELKTFPTFAGDQQKQLGFGESGRMAVTNNSSCAVMFSSHPSGVQATAVVIVDMHAPLSSTIIGSRDWAEKANINLSWILWGTFGCRRNLRLPRSSF